MSHSGRPPQLFLAPLFLRPHQPFSDATAQFSREDIPLISSVIPAIDHIDVLLNDFAINSEFSTSIRSACSLGKKLLNKYYCQSDESEIYRIAMGKSYKVFSLLLG